MGDYMFDYLIVGAGFAGSVLAERIATQLNKKVLIIDKRNHIGGNSYDYYDDNGILIHKYGPHIFHTNSKYIIDYLSNFTEWQPYFHRVLAVIDGKKVPVPFNLNSIYLLFSKKFAEKLEEELVHSFGYGIKIPILKLREKVSGNLKFLAEYIYQNVFYGYTLKQWEFKPEDLDPAVTARVPVFISRDDRYFQDSYQLMPKFGFTKMFEKMLSHKNIHILLQTDYKDISSFIKFDKLIFTGPIDEFFDYIYGELPYRSLDFVFETNNVEYYQETGTVNYPNNYDFTRITEFKYLTNQKSHLTSIVYEYPRKYVDKINQEPYYPIPQQANHLLYKKYLELADNYKNIIFCGRLADYQYYEMQQVIARALKIFETKISKNV